MTESIRDWLAARWVAGALFMALCLLAILPMLMNAWPPALLLIFLHAPIYMLHQVEEHGRDRFRTYVNQKVFGGVEALTTDAVLWINIPCVWGLTLVALYAAWLVAPGWGLMAPYLVIINAVTHLANAIKRREYNPGLLTSIFLFLPLGLATLYAIAGTMQQTVFALCVALLVHVMIVVTVLHHARQLRSVRPAAAK
ncbi:HXXEE domain-containing protein [Aestuariivirga sp.]|uniref:HXXEE domain-containing protein n=1 Tax=Aestuariivirga sp. TaxID=2650926 RepID=UPI003593BC26